MVSVEKVQVSKEELMKAYLDETPVTIELSLGKGKKLLFHDFIPAKITPSRPSIIGLWRASYWNVVFVREKDAAQYFPNGGPRIMAWLRPDGQGNYEGSGCVANLDEIEKEILNLAGRR